MPARASTGDHLSDRRATRWKRIAESRARNPLRTKESDAGAAQGFDDNREVALGRAATTIVSVSEMARGRDRAPLDPGLVMTT
ncbi:hypothetical protein RJ55_04413 [Drechmeria coniospora]|nr:hypothetical protein RJ55_04413 [Drechmeria coniospora]